MELIFGQVITDKSNKINRLPYNISWIPIITITSYFSKYENIYFLLLAIIQLLTWDLLPSTWSPTGPFSTAVPLFVFIFVEIIINIVKWVDIKKKDNEENSKQYQILIDEQLHLVQNEELYVGNVIYLKKDEICPMDSILLKVEDDTYAKINMALLTGENNIHYISKPSNNLCLHHYQNAKLVYTNSNKYQAFSGKLTVNNENFTIDKNNYIATGSIIKSNAIFVWAIAHGNKISKKTFHKSSRIDKFVGDYIISINVYQLIAIILISSLAKTIYLNDTSSFFIFCIQNWILFNGIIPFSVKILLVMARYAEGLMSNKSIIVNESLQIDDFGKIKKIICDKTGTITMNNLEFVKLVCDNTNVTLSDHIFNCLGLCIHTIDNDFATIEDKIIYDGFQKIGGSCIVVKNKGFELQYNGKSKEFVYLESNGLEFTFDRKMSSQIVKNNDNYFIYSKGSLDIMKTKLINPFDMLTSEKIITEKNPELRLLVIAYRQLNLAQVCQMVNNNNHDFLEKELIFLGIVCIHDTLQPMVKETVQELNNYGIPISLCTGDRKITAMAVAEEIGMMKKNNVINFECNTNPAFYYDQTMIFNGNIINQITNLENFSEALIHCQNFIGYNMTPHNKKIVVELLETNNIPIIAIGDGYNDLGMFDKASITVSIKGNNFIENYTDFSINQFSNIKHLFHLSIISYLKNSTLINLTFYRTTMVVFTIVLHCIINYDKEYQSPFTAFVLQAFNFAWTSCALVYLVLQKRKINPIQDFASQKISKYTNNQFTTNTSLSAAITAMILVYTIYYIYHPENYHNVLTLIIISVLNLKIFNSIPKDWVSLLACTIGIALYLIYLFFTSYSN